jgi:hypothetical protein
MPGYLYGKDKVMSELRLPITPELFFNSVVYTHMIIMESAQKHYSVRSIDIYNYIARTLNGQNRSHDDVNRSGEKIYHLASHIDTCDVPAISEYRDTCFKLDETNGTIIFFHGSPRQEKRYEKFPEKSKRRIE